MLNAGPLIWLMSCWNMVDHAWVLALMWVAEVGHILVLCEISASFNYRHDKWRPDYWWCAVCIQPLPYKLLFPTLLLDPPALRHLLHTIRYATLVVHYNKIWRAGSPHVMSHPSSVHTSWPNWPLSWKSRQKIIPEQLSPSRGDFRALRSFQGTIISTLENGCYKTVVFSTREDWKMMPFFLLPILNILTT